MRFPLFLTLLLAPLSLLAAELFLEAENFRSTGGWSRLDDRAVRAASGLAVLSGASGAKDGVATATASVKDAGRYRVWVRYSSHPKWRGAFHVTALAGERVLGDAVFDTAFEGKSARDSMTWGSFEAELPEGEITLRLSKHEQQNASGLARLIDCLLLTMDPKLVPNHLHYGAQTFVRITIGEGYERPVYLHIFADHYHAPWYQHYSLGRSGAVAGVTAPAKEMLRSGERTAWCNLTPMIYQDSGAALCITARHAYTEQAQRLRAKFEFATAPDDSAIVRTIPADFQPAGFSVLMPPNLLTPENVALFKTAHEIAEETGRLADAHPWPAYGRKPERFPFFATIARGQPQFARDAALTAREEKTFDLMGLADERGRTLHGAWLMKNGSYCKPDVEKMRERIAVHAEEFRKEGGDVKRVVFCELTDEPTGQPLEFMAGNAAYQERFRAWVRGMGKSPADLLVADWDSVKTVTEKQRDAFPALYFFSQRFRTRALGDFMAVQRGLVEEAYDGTFPVLVNFSDGAIYTGNFYTQGVDYFELLSAPDQNAIWGEDWSNNASTYQCATFNVDLMRAAARDRGQVIGHHLVAHANRKPWDVKLKATSEVARGVKMLNSFCYGPKWATHEGGPWWRSHVSQSKPEMWTAHAELAREIGAVEDALLPAMPAPAQVALLYSSSSDVWTVGDDNAFGFDRMHTWLALSHAQVPVDIVSEAQAEAAQLARYRVCYLTGPNLTRAAATQLAEWVKRGGTLWLTAGAAMRDEFNRPLRTLDEILPATRGDVQPLQKFQSSGRYLVTLAPKGEVASPHGTAELLAARQPITEKPGSEIRARFNDGTPALVVGAVGDGAVLCCGFLPGLSYIRPALAHRDALQKKIESGAALEATEQAEAKLIERSYNPWKFPDAVRALLLEPVRQARIEPPITCSHALVDAVFMPHERGILIPLANYTLEPIATLTLRIKAPRPIASATSARHGALAFQQDGLQTIEVVLPLENNDFVTLQFR